MRGNGHFRTSELLDMVFFCRVRHMARSHIGSSFLSDSNLYISTTPKRWRSPRWLEKSTKLVRSKRKAQSEDGSLQVVERGYGTE